MQIHLARNSAPLGVFSEEEVRAKLSRGELTGTELAWREGMGDWQPLNTLISGGGIQPLFSPQGSAVPSQTPIATTSGLAIGSLVCGIVGLCAWVPSLAAVIMGHIALSQIKRSQGALTGRGLAIGGLVTGYLILAIFPLAIIASLMIPSFNLVQNLGDQQKAASNCKQILSALSTFAAENNGMYPDSTPNPVTGAMPLTSNDAFRRLFQETELKDEKIFGCPASRYQPDANIGTPPTYDKTLEPWENHWAMTAGQANSSTSIMPLVFENPVEASWPPKWNADRAGKPVAGRAWAGGKIIVGKNDGSTEIIKLESARGAAVGPRTNSNGKDLFTEASAGMPQQILNIATGGGQAYQIGNFQDSGLPPPPDGALPGYPGGLPPPPAK